ncbi:MAG: rhodanese-like domain-containing protein [Actinomycetales bacterium]
MSPTPASPPTLGTAELQAALAAGTVRVLDVRTPAEFETVHIPGSYNVPLDTLTEHREELSQHLGSDVVLVCRSGFRAGQAGRTLAGTGVPGLRLLDGGVLAWEQAGGAVRRGRPRWDIERQVRLVAGGIVLVSVLASLVVPYAQVLAGVIGAGLAFAALSNSCLMGQLLLRLPYNRTAACDIGDVVGRLTATGAPPARGA